QPLINERFRGQISNLEVSPTAELFSDRTNYFIGPHTDHPTRLLNMFFYLPEDDSREHLGTSFYVPNDPTFTCKGGPHYKFKDFTRVFTAPYKRNKLAIFFKNDRSFHGVEPVEEKN